MSDRIRWRYTKQELYNTGSRKCGILEEKELNYRQQAANYIRDMGHSLNQPQLCINTAIVYMHRFYMYHSFSRFHQFSQNTIAPAALFLASKVEEHPKRLEAVIKAARRLVVKEGPPLDVRSSEYQRLVEEVETNETILLQTLGFDLVVDHAHTHILKCCKIFKANKDELTRAAYNIASESLYLTTMCLEYSATAIACFCIYLACKWTNWEIPCSLEGKPWWWYVDNTVTPELLQKMTTEFLNVFDKSPSRLKQKIRSSTEQFSKSRNSSMANNSSVQDHKKLEHSPNSDESRSSASSRFQASLDQEAESPKTAQKIPFQNVSALHSPNLGFNVEYTIRGSSSDSSIPEGNGTVIRHGRTEYIPAALRQNPDKNSSISSAIQNSLKQDKNLNSSIKNNCTQVSQPPPPLRRDSSHNQASHRISDKQILRPQQNIESAKNPSGTIRERARSLHEKLPEYKIRESSTPPVDFSNIFNAEPVQNNYHSSHDPLQIAQNPEIHPQIPRTTNIKTEQPSAEKIPVHRPGTLINPQESNKLEAPSIKKELISPTKSISSILRQAQAPLPSLLSSLDSGCKSSQNSNNDKSYHLNHTSSQSSHLNHTSSQNSNNDTSYHLNHTSSQSSHLNHTSSQNSNNDTSYHLNHTSSQNSSQNSNKYASYHLNKTSSQNSIQNSNNDTSYHLNHTSSHNLIHNSNQNLNQVSCINSNHNLSQHSNDTLPSLPTIVSPLSCSSDLPVEECEAHSMTDGHFSSPIDIISTDGNIFFPGIFDVQENVEVEAESTDKKKKKKEKKDKHKERSKEKKKSKHKEKKDKNKDKYKEKNKTEVQDCGPIKIKIPMEKINLPPQTKNTENRAPGGLKLTLKIPKERIQSDIHGDSAGHQVHGSLKIKIRTSGGACELSGRSKRSVELVNIDDSPAHKRARV